jgi:hypothetical protein
MNGLLAGLAMSAFFATATEANAKSQTRSTPQKVPHSRNVSRPSIRSAAMQASQHQSYSDIYESSSGGRQIYPNPDRDFSTVRNHPFW